MDDHPNIIHGKPLERLINESLGDLLITLLKSSEKNIIMVDPSTSEEISADHLLARSIQVAKWLKTHNVGIGDRVTVNSENRIEFAVSVVATFLVAATFAPLNPDYTEVELKHVLQLSKPKVIFCSKATIKKMLAVKPNHQHIEKLVLYGTEKHSNAEIIMFENIVQGITQIDESYVAPDIDVKETIATILCSSGTTGLPKGVLCTHDNILTLMDIGRTEFTEILLNDDPSDPIVGLTPFFHSFGFMLMLFNILRGKKMVIIKKFHPKMFLDAIVNYKVTRLIVPPAVLLALLKNPIIKNYDLSCLQDIKSGAAPLGKDIEKELKTRFKVKSVAQAYGLTETTLGVLMHTAGDSGEKAGSVGKIAPGMIVKVINKKSEPLGSYQEGELCFKGPLIMKGYVDDPKATAETIDKHGWLHTGDIGYYDDDKCFYIVDRIKELIKYKGFQVAPAELEALLLTHPTIQDAAVIGLPDEDAGELPLAFVVKKENNNLSEEEVKKFVSDSLSHQKKLRGGVIFTNEILRNASGKILRRVLRERAKELVKLRAKL